MLPLALPGWRNYVTVDTQHSKCGRLPAVRSSLTLRCRFSGRFPRRASSAGWGAPAAAAQDQAASGGMLSSSNARQHHPAALAVRPAAAAAAGHRYVTLLRQQFRLHVGLAGTPSTCGVHPKLLSSRFHDAQSAAVSCYGNGS